MTADAIRSFVECLVCLRCHEAIAPGDPLDVTICGNCFDDLRQEDDGTRMLARMESSPPGRSDGDAAFPW